ncbi:Fungal specific transcription factor domain [Ceratobasidium sp. AG-Ba]|nr:Fungal specific transcription factor domain [Ceratobasidium sp. AG-Ba]
MSHQVLSPCARTLGKRTILQRVTPSLLPGQLRPNSTLPTGDTPVASTSSSKPSAFRLFGGNGGTAFFSPSHAPAPRPSKWPLTPESAELRVLLLRRDSPANMIYDAYLRLVTNPLHIPLPQSMHQLVLRRAVPHVSSVRLPNYSDLPDSFTTRHETRLREIIFHTRAAGVEPTLGDYHFVLEHMAALGHQRTAYSVYMEIVKLGHKPTERTIAWVLLALVRRHKMRIYDDHMGAVMAESHGIADRLLGDLLRLQSDKSASPISSMTLDLACRVFKITGNLEKFLALLKSGYGVDVLQPDYRPLEFAEQMQIRASSSGTRPSIPRFSTHTLNTTLDMLGRSGKIQEMVATFEVITNPLPASARADSYQYDVWEDDEPESRADSNSHSSNRLSEYVPSATPNTTSLSFMIKHTVDFARFDFCKHYLLLAIHLDRQSDTHLRQQLRVALKARREYAAAAELEAKSNLPTTYTLPPSYSDPPVDSPRVSVTYEMFTKVWGLANRKAHMRSLRGLVRTVRRVIRRKRRDIEVYKTVIKAVPSLGSLVSSPSTVENEEDEEGIDGEMPPWANEMIEKRPPQRRSFNLVAHVALLEAETEKLDHFLLYGIRGVEHSSARIKAEETRKKEKKVEQAARVAQEAEKIAQKVKELKEEKERRKAEKTGGAGGDEMASVLVPA